MKTFLLWNMKLNYYLNNDINWYYCLNFYIMVKTKRLCWTLGRVLGRALSRQVYVDEDVENVDNVVDEPHEEPQDPITEDVGGDS